MLKLVKSTHLLFIKKDHAVYESIMIRETGREHSKHWK